MLRPGIGVASPSNSLSTPAMILSSVDLPEPFRPSTPILAPGKKLRDTPLRISRFGGTILPRRFIVNTYCAIWVTCERDGGRRESRGGAATSQNACGPGTRMARITGPTGEAAAGPLADHAILLARADDEVIGGIAA